MLIPVAQTPTHWLDSSRYDALCFGPMSTVSKRWNLITTTGRACPLGMKINYFSALLVSSTKVNTTKGFVFHSLHFSSRCIHCELLMRMDGILPAETTVGHTCLARGCTDSAWQGVGIYCSTHYLACHQIHELGRQISIPDPPESFISKVPRLLRNLATQVTRWEGSKLEPIFRALSDSHPGRPNIYALDTEFCSITGRFNVTEVAIVNVRTDKLVVHAIFNDKRGMIASTKLARLLRSEHGQNTSAEITSHVRQVRTVEQMVQQIKDCRFQPNDIFIEYSNSGQSCLDMRNVRWLLDRHGFRTKDLIPCEGTYGVLQPIKKFVSQVLPFDCWKLPFHFRGFFPNHSLVDQNHSAAVDSLQLAIITRLTYELSKPAEERNLPADLFQGLEKLPSLSTETMPTNTLDRYFEPLGDIENAGIQRFEDISEQAAAEEISSVFKYVSKPSGATPRSLVDSLGKLEYDDEFAVHLPEDIESMPTGIVTRCKMKRQLNESPVSQDFTNSRKKRKTSNTGQ
jgi:hypothetical protein